MTDLGLSVLGGYQLWEISCGRGRSMATSTIDRGPLTTSPSQSPQCSDLRRPEERRLGGGELLLEGYALSGGASGSVNLWRRASRPLG